MAQEQMEPNEEEIPASSDFWEKFISTLHREMTRRKFLVLGIGTVILSGCGQVVRTIDSTLTTQSPTLGSVTAEPETLPTVTPTETIILYEPLPYPQATYPVSLDPYVPGNNPITYGEILFDKSHPERGKLVSDIVYRWEAILKTTKWEQVFISSEKGWAMLARKDGRFFVPRTWQNPDLKNVRFLIPGLSPYGFLDRPVDEFDYVIVNDPPGMQDAELTAAIYNGWPIITAEKKGQQAYLDASADIWRRFDGTPLASAAEDTATKIAQELERSGGAYRLISMPTGFAVEALRTYRKPPNTYPEPTPSPPPPAEWLVVAVINDAGVEVRTTDYYDNNREITLTIPTSAFRPEWNPARGELTVKDPATGAEYAYHRTLGTWIGTELRPGVPTTWEAANWADGERLKQEGMAYVREYLDVLIPLERAYMEKHYPDLPKTLRSAAFGTSTQFFENAPFYTKELDSGRFDMGPTPILSITRMPIDGHLAIILGVPLILRREDGRTYTHDDVLIFHLMLEDDGTFAWFKFFTKQYQPAMKNYLQRMEIGVLESEIAAKRGEADVNATIFLWVNPAFDPPSRVSGEYEEDPDLAREMGFTGAAAMFDAWCRENPRGTGPMLAYANWPENSSFDSAYKIYAEFERFFFPVFRLEVIE